MNISHISSKTSEGYIHLFSFVGPLRLLTRRGSNHSFEHMIYDSHKKGVVVTHIRSLIFLSPGHFGLDLFNLFHYTHLECIF